MNPVPSMSPAEWKRRLKANVEFYTRQAWAMNKHIDAILDECQRANRLARAAFEEFKALCEAEDAT